MPGKKKKSSGQHAFILVLTCPGKQQRDRLSCQGTEDCKYSSGWLGHPGFDLGVSCWISKPYHSLEKVIHEAEAHREQQSDAPVAGWERMQERVNLTK